MTAKDRLVESGTRIHELIAERETIAADLAEARRLLTECLAMIERPHDYAGYTGSTIDNVRAFLARTGGGE